MLRDILLTHHGAGEFPLWDNANYTTGAMRVTGLGSARRYALVFEAVVYAVRESEIQRHTFVYGNGKQAGGFARLDTLISRGQLVEDVSPDETRSRVTGLTTRWAPDFTRELWLPAGGIANSFRVEVLGNALTLKVELPSMRDAKNTFHDKLRRIEPNEAILFQLCDCLGGDALMMAEDSRLVAIAGLPRAARRRFRFDAWKHPSGAVPSDIGPDLEAMCRALEESGSLDGIGDDSNTDWRHWLDVWLRDRDAEREEAWGIGAEVLPSTEPASKKKEGRKRAKTARAPAVPWLETVVHPSWNSGLTPVGLMRAYGFSAPRGAVLAFDSVCASRRFGEVRRELHGYGPGIPDAPLFGFVGPSEVLVAPAQIYEGEGASPLLCKVEYGQTLSVQVLGETRDVLMALPGGERVAKPKLLRRLAPAQVVLYQLCEQLGDRLLLESKELASRLGLAKAAKLLFVVDVWEHPPEGKKLSISADLNTMAASAATGRAPEGLSGAPNDGWRRWIDQLLPKYPAASSKQWPGR